MVGKIPAEVAIFASQSPFTEPGGQKAMFRGLPSSVPELCKVVQGLVVHYRGPEVRKARIPRQRMKEVDTRLVSKMLTRLKTMDDRPLTEVRPVERRIVGCCRDFAVLFCSMARSVGIPARIRVGFATYFRDAPVGFHVDHTIAEVWDRTRGGWRLVDPEQSESLVRRNRLTFEPTDVPRTSFLVGGRAWQMCRSSEADPLSFGVERRGPLRGLWFVRTRLILDFAALNRQELLLWDSWGPMSPEVQPAPRDLRRYDRIARLAQGGNEALSMIRRTFEADRALRPPRLVWTFSPVARPFRSRLPE